MTETTLLEREAPRQLLDETIRRTGPTAGGAVLLVSGEAGIGKTAFVSAFAAALARQRKIV